MIRALMMAIIAACAAPALAQTCKITRTAEGFTTLASVKLKGAEAHDVLLDTGPSLAKVVFAAGAKGYSVKKGEQAALYLFRRGKSNAGTDWRTAGTIANGGQCDANPKLCKTAVDLWDTTVATTTGLRDELNDHLKETNTAAHKLAENEHRAPKKIQARVE